MHLPEDIGRDILSRLPVKSLIRFRCVQRSWVSLFQNPNFINQHIDRSISSNTTTFIFNRGCKGLSVSAISNYKLSVTSFNVQHPFLTCANIMGSSNGLVCVFLYSSRYLYLLNPATREYIDTACPFPDDNSSGVVGFSLFGFSFIEELNDYVIVASFFRSNDKFIVYKRNSNSWVTKKTSKLQYDGIDIASDTVVKGSFNWIASKKDIGKVILSYNVGNEDFEEIEFPDSLWQIMHITKLKDSLAIVSAYRWNNVHYDYEIWVMNEYGVKESWTKKFIIDGIFGYKPVLTCQENIEGEITLLTQRHNLPEFVKYIPKKQEVITLSGAPNYIWRADVYVESLVPVRIS
ncbi:hypothetical protein JCGZ_23809 [Jatropha curcas]|uniref:F-box domain-containing protein n=1 Tax=Jatropha curcas TaxID=180498 RepID=A0A067L378_JATCU|nr:F-box/kelch-repeat protein At3g23880 [Jatropha curcas]KDP42867.1 hypothetical protein JCGZ_23809 [Jatropha curcas]